MHGPYYAVPVRTTVCIEGHTDSIEILVNGKSVAFRGFDERTSLFGDLLVKAIEKAIAGCDSMCSNELLNTITEYSDGAHTFGQ